MEKVPLIGILSRVTFFLFFCTSLVASFSKHEIQCEDGPLVYYAELPDSDSYPIVIALEGSFDSSRGVTSVLKLHKKLSGLFLKENIGLITMEKRGVNGKQIDHEMFHSWNIPSQRLKDHIKLVEHLKKSFLPFLCVETGCLYCNCWLF